MTLNTPDNPRLHNQPAFVTTITEWGAHVLTEAAATGRFRAAHNEMVLKEDTNGVARTEKVLTARDLEEEQSRARGYTGDPCGKCGALAMRQSGACTVCDVCGNSGGCG